MISVCLNAGVAAEYFLKVKQSFPLPPVDHAPASTPAPAYVPPVTPVSDLSCGLSTLPVGRQNHIILHLMFSLMTPEILVEYEMYETPATSSMISALGNLITSTLKLLRFRKSFVMQP